MAIKHAFTSTKADGPDATRVRPSNWNEDHVGTVPAADVPIADAGNRYTATEAEGALQELAGAGRTTQTVKGNADAIAAAMPPGTILMYGGSSAPSGFLLCDGAAVSETTYAALFAVIGHGFGGDPGGGNFYVPNLKGVSPTGVGAQDINGRTKTGPALGEVREDQFQKHLRNFRFKNAAGNAGLTAANYHPVCDAGGSNFGQSNAADVDNPNIVGTEITDGVNGTPRTGAYTHGPEIGLNFIIRY